MGAFKFGTAAFLWFAMTDIDPWIATALTLMQTAVTTAMSVGVHTFDFIFSRRMTEDRIEEVSSSREYVRRQIFELIIVELTRLMSGPVNSAHSVFSVLGQGEIFSNVLVRGSGFSIFSRIRRRELNPDASKWMNVAQYTLTTPLILMDQMGIHMATLADFGHFKVNLSTVLIMASYAGLTAAVLYAPKYIEDKIKPLDKKMRQFSNYLKEKNYFDRIKNYGGSISGRIKDKCGGLTSRFAQIL